jgi:hypothetical protein
VISVRTGLIRAQKFQFFKTENPLRWSKATRLGVLGYISRLGGGAMKRRVFIGVIGGAAIAWPLVALAQQSSGKVWRVAYLYPGTLDNPPDRALFDAFRAEMRELGYIEGKNLVIDNRDAEGKAERLPSLVAS